MEGRPHWRVQGQARAKPAHGAGAHWQATSEPNRLCCCGPDYYLWTKTIFLSSSVTELDFWRSQRVQPRWWMFAALYQPWRPYFPTSHLVLQRRVHIWPSSDQWGLSVLCRCLWPSPFLMKRQCCLSILHLSSSSCPEFGCNAGSLGVTCCQRGEQYTQKWDKRWDNTPLTQKTPVATRNGWRENSSSHLLVRL